MNKRFNFDRTNTINIMTHIIVLLIVFILPDFIFSAAFGRQPHDDRHVQVYLQTTAYIVAFYINYFILIDKFLFKKKTFTYIIVTLLFAIAMLFLMRFLHLMISVLTNDGPPKIPPKEWDNRFFLIGFMLRDFAMIILTIGLSIAVKFSLRWGKIEKMNKQIITEQREMELSNLKNQLNPHFLFNTLNNIYSLIDIDPEKAQESIHQLSKMLRYTLYENANEVPLENDLQFMRNYIELMKLRLSDNNKLTVSICDCSKSNLMIAPLLFISLVENAFKHGVSGSKPSQIKISISLDGQCVCCHVENSLFPKSEDLSKDKNSGIGIANLRRRLSLIYEHRHIYTSVAAGNRYVAELKIDLTPQKQQNGNDTKMLRD